jgi:3'(2'), 5'-bisphosphate nucleotidase
MYESERNTAVEIVAEVCRLTRRVQEDIVAADDAVTKPDRSPVTLADLAAQVVVSVRLAERYPKDPLLAEESSAVLAGSKDLSQHVLEQVRRHVVSLRTEDLAGALDRGGYSGGGTGRYWVLDPIDGTKGFLRGDQYAVALALVVDGSVTVGVLGCPNLPDPPPGTGAGRLFSAIRGGGSVSHDLDGKRPRPIRVDAISDPSDAVVCESVEAAHAAHSVQAGIAQRLGITAPPYRIDSQCKYAVVARGEASIYLRLPRDKSYREKVWDHAAGSLVIEEAGGEVSDLDGSPLDFSKGRLLGNHRGIVATNGAVHDQVVAACRAELELD